MNVHGLVQGIAPKKLRMHMKVTPGSLGVNVTVIWRVLIVPRGAPLIVTVGGVVSTTHVRIAGVGSTLPAEPIARTANVCGPSGSGPSESGDVHGANGAPSRLHSNVELGFDDENVICT